MAQCDDMDTDRMDESDDTTQRSGSKTYSQEQKREKSLKITGKSVKESFKKRINKFSFTYSRPNPIFSRPPPIDSSPQQGKISHASVATLRSQSYDNHQPEPCKRCDEICAAYEAKITDTKAFYQQEHDDEKKHAEHLQAEIVARNTTIDNLNTTIDELRSHLDGYNSHNRHLDSILTARDAEINDLKTHYTRVQHELKATIRQRDEAELRVGHLMSEATVREEKVRALKHTISKFRAGNSHVVPDNQLNSDYEYLISQLKNWTHSNFRGSKPTETEKTIVDFGIIPEERRATFEAVHKCLTDTGSRKFLAIDTLVMRYLGRQVFDRFIFGLDESEEMFYDGLISSLEETSTQKEINFWRSTTIKMVIATESHKRKTKDRKKEIVQEMESILVNTLPSSANSTNATRRMENLEKIVDQAVELSFNLRVQRPAYHMYWVGVRKGFSNALLELAEDNMDDSDTGSVAEDQSYLGGLFPRRKKSSDIVGLTIFPSLIKSGNEDGENYEENICISKGRALKL